MTKKLFKPSTPISVAPVEQTAEQAEQEVKDYFGEGPIPQDQGQPVPEITPTDDIQDLFGEEAPAMDLGQLEGMAKSLAVMQGRIAELKAELLTLTIGSGPNRGTGKADILEKALHVALVNNHCTKGHDFDCGLKPVPVIKERWSKDKSVEDSIMFKWLRAHDLGDNIKETAGTWNSVNAFLSKHQEQYGDLPEEIFRKSETQVIRFGTTLKPWLANQES